MKKGKFELSVFGIFISMFVIQLVSAQNELIDNFINRMSEAFSSIFEPLIGMGVSSDFLFAKVLLFFLIFAVVFMAVKRIRIFRNNMPVRVIITIIVSILSVRYLGETDFTRLILLPYGALGGSISIFLPLMIYFFFIHTSIDGSFGRRFAWILYGAFFIILWGTREYMGSANWIYIISLGFILASFIFDKTLHQYFEYGKFDKARRRIIKRRIVEVLDEIKTTKGLGLSAEDLEDEYQDLVKKLS